MTREQQRDITVDTLTNMLSSERRRRVIRHLIHESGVSINTLAEEIASIENDRPVDALTRKQRKRVYVSLYQTHLDKLEAAGICNVTDTGDVYRGDQFDAAVDALDGIDDAITPEASQQTGGVITRISGLLGGESA